jgi:hypothetical protein
MCRLCVSLALLAAGHVSCIAAQDGLHALPVNFQGKAGSKMAGLESWGKLLGSTLLFNQARQTPVGLAKDTHTFHKQN